MNHGIRLDLGGKMAASLCPQRAAKFPLAHRLMASLTKMPQIRAGGLG
jgi:hypothetical protein